MSELAAAQRMFGAALAAPASGADAAPLFVGEPDRVRARLAVYRGNVIANAGRALANAYPVIRQLVGEDFFGGLHRAYADAWPSSSGDLNEYGHCFASFLDTFAHVRDLPYLADVARLEWLVHIAHYAGDHPSFDPARLRAVAEGEYSRLVLELHPSVGLLASTCPVARIWEVHQPGYEGDVAVDLGGGGENVLVCRPHYRAVVAALGAGELEFLVRAARAETLAAALEQALAADAGFDLGASLQRWIGLNVIVDCAVGA